jgi:hypothetical protein
MRRLEPLGPTESLAFLHGWSLRERVFAYAIVGGMPAYLRRFDTRVDLRTNLLREVLRPEGYLFDEVQFLLRSELSNPATYNSLLAAIARGASKLNDIATDVGVDSTTANKYLHTLRELRLVDQSIARLEEALGLLDAGVGANPGRLIENRFLAGRVRSLLDLARAGRRILDGLVRAGAVDLSSIRGALSARIEARLER